MPWIAGVDGCKGGWIVVLAFHRDGAVSEIAHRGPLTFQEVLDLQPAPTFIAIDIPIGLLAERQIGGRHCDIQARHKLGKPRSNSIFSPPIRGLLSETDFSKLKGMGISIQSFSIFPKIKEVDQAMTPRLQTRVFEVHPELCFWHLKGTPAQHNKKSVAGRRERILALSKYFPHVQDSILNFRQPGVAKDDLIDAYLAVWTGIQIDLGRSLRLPEVPVFDTKVLRMEISY